MISRWIKRLILTLFILMNLVAAFHAWHFTHFSDAMSEKTADPSQLGLGKRIMTLLTGVSNPRPVNNQVPLTPFQTITLHSNKTIECWLIPAESPKGTVVICHGYSGNKSSMLSKAVIFRQMGYNTLLPDFMGSGGSEGNQTTIGFYEAEEVASCFRFLEESGEHDIILAGTSMGAVAIMKALNDQALKPAAVILECPFGSMYQTVCARFKSMNTPAFPMAALLVFWGGAENGFWAFGHNPSRYAEAISCPTLLMYGAKDEKVSADETNEIFSNLRGRKKLRVFLNAGHENYLNQYKDEWTSEVQSFLNGLTDAAQP